MKFVYFLVECWEWLGDLLLICWCCIPCCLLRSVIKMVISSFSLSMSFSLYLRHGCGKRIYHFEGRIVSRDRYYILRDVSRRKGYYYRGSCRAPWQMHGQICPHGSRTEWQRVCIVKKDMHHYIWHCISWHCTFYYWWTWTCVLMILRLFLCEACDCWILSCYWECVNW